MINCQIKSMVLKDYLSGDKVCYLCQKYNIARSTIYDWIKKNKIYRDSKGKNEISYDSYIQLKRELKNAQQTISILFDANCLPTAPRKAKLEAINKLFGKYPTKTMCRVLDVDHATFYNYHFRRTKLTKNEMRDEDLKKIVLRIYLESDKRFGSKKIVAKMQAEGYFTTTDKVTKLMKVLNIQSRQAKKRTYVQPESKAPAPPHILQRAFIQSEPNKFWVGDITYIKYPGGTVYLCAIMDLFSRKIIAHHISHKCDTNLAINTFKSAFEYRGEPEGLCFHSDRGSTYLATEYRALLASCGVQQSCSKKGNPYDNAVIESFFSTLKREEVNSQTYSSYRDLKDKMKKYIDFYNDYRPHERLSNRTPNQVEDAFWQQKIGQSN